MLDNLIQDALQDPTTKGVLLLDDLDLCIAYGGELDESDARPISDLLSRVLSPSTSSSSTSIPTLPSNSTPNTDPNSSSVTKSNTRPRPQVGEIDYGGFGSGRAIQFLHMPTHTLILLKSTIPSPLAKSYNSTTSARTIKLLGSMRGAIAKST